jgi:hypothetical protein
MLDSKNWTLTLVLATLAVALAAVGLASTAIAPGATPVFATSLLLGSLAGTAGAFTLVALRVHRLELENLGLIEEVAQEFDRVRDRMDIFSEALAEPRSLAPGEAAPRADEPLRRVMVK